MTGSNQRALAEPGEPPVLVIPGEPAVPVDPTSTVWYRWTAPGSGMYQFTTEGSTFDTELAAQIGTSITALTPLKFNDDSILGSQSIIKFQASSGTTYWIWVDGFGCDKGAIQLNWGPA